MVDTGKAFVDLIESLVGSRTAFVDSIGPLVGLVVLLQFLGGPFVGSEGSFELLDGIVLAVTWLWVDDAMIRFDFNLEELFRGAIAPHP